MATDSTKGKLEQHQELMDVWWGRYITATAACDKDPSKRIYRDMIADIWNRLCEQRRELYDVGFVGEYRKNSFNNLTNSK